MALTHLIILEIPIPFPTQQNWQKQIVNCFHLEIKKRVGT
jgi:hypothetical protein